MIRAVKKIYWSYLSLKSKSRRDAYRYVFDAVCTLGFRHNAVIAGDFSFNNFGDDLAGITMGQVLGARVLKSSLMSAPSAKCLLVGAGGLIRPDDPDPLGGYRDIVSHFTPSGLVSTGFNRDLKGESISLGWQDALARNCQSYDFIAVRDHFAYFLFEKLGIPTHAFIPDVALIPKVRQNSIDHLQSQRSVLICPNSHSAPLAEMRSDIIRLYTNVVGMLQSKGFQVKLCPLQSHSGRFDDVALVREIASRCSRMPMILDRVPEVVEYEEMCRESKFVLSGRLHGAVVAARVGVPFLALAYNFKQYSFVEMLHSEEFLLDVYSASAEGILAKVNTLLSKYELHTIRLREQVTAVQQIIEKELSVLKDWVQKPSKLRLPGFSNAREVFERLNLPHTLSDAAQAACQLEHF